MQQSLLLDTINGKKCERPPVWFMRQAGRVLPSYRKIRESHSFREIMNDPKLAAEVTLLPVKELGVDAAILFSDILVIPEALGMELHFNHKGPTFNHHPQHSINQTLNTLKPDPEKLNYIYNNIGHIIQKKILDHVRQKNIPVIFFPKGIGTGITEINTNITDVLSIDWQPPIKTIRKFIDKPYETAFI